jgi:hypothetical protein
MSRLIDKAVETAKTRREARAYKRAWDAARSEAPTATHRAEIDMLFSQRLR